MTASRDEWIKKRAYSLWEEEGYPTGKDAAHWEQATKEHGAIEKTGSKGLEVKAKGKRAPAAKSAAAPTKAPAAASTSKAPSAAKAAAPKATSSNGAVPPAAVVTKRTTKKSATVKV